MLAINVSIPNLTIAVLAVLFVRSLFASRCPAYSKPQRWDLLNLSNAPAHGEEGSW